MLCKVKLCRQIKCCGEKKRTLYKKHPRIQNEYFHMEIDKAVNSQHHVTKRSTQRKTTRKAFYPFFIIKTHRIGDLLGQHDQKRLAPQQLRFKTFGYGSTTNNLYEQIAEYAEFHAPLDAYTKKIYKSIIQIKISTTMQIITKQMNNG